MRKVLLLAGVACFAAASASAFEFNPYVGAKAKYVLARNEVKVTGTVEGKDKFNDNIWGGSVLLGTVYPVTNGDFRFELEYTKNGDTKKDGVTVKTQAFLFNVYYDFNVQLALPIKPYVGFGLGWGRAELESQFKNVKDDGAAMHIGGGIDYRISENAVVDLGYRYITYGDFDEEFRAPGLYEKFDYKPRAHEIMLGVRYEF